MSDTLQYNLLSNNSSFDNDFTSKSNKYILVKKLEENLINESNMEPQENNVLVVAFMSLIRRIPMGQGSIIYIPRSFEYCLETY